MLPLAQHRIIRVFRHVAPGMKYFGTNFILKFAHILNIDNNYLVGHIKPDLFCIVGDALLLILATASILMSVRKITHHLSPG